MREEFDIQKSFRELSEIGVFKELFSYNQSEENKKRCESFEFLNQKYILLQKQYVKSFQELFANVDDKAYRKEYAKGGATIHRGFYSPSSLDLVVGGCHRGKLFKRIPKNGEYDYEYIFDDQGKLICSKKYSNQINNVFGVMDIELFVYEQNRVLSFVFDPFYNNAISFISECQYENKTLTRYESALCNLCYGGKGCVEINVETFEYVDGTLKSIFWSRYAPSIQLLDQNKFIFSRDKEGYLSTYIVEQVGGFVPKNDINCGSISYKCRVKRK